MGITIEEIIEELESTKDYPASDPASDEALDGAIKTMRKYQKIQEVMEHWVGTQCVEVDLQTLFKIREVLEDGSN